ncbi:MAG: tRNA uridine-5-carboxymethylaminomethyl(34) synthesis GTPase MnmE [Alphaproteobacteria bacterium]
MQDTIYALASGRGKAGVAVVRISGTAAVRSLESLTGRPADAFPGRKAVRALLRHPDSGEPLDDALAIRFPGPRSYTGEEVVELHLHGGTAVVAAVLGALGAQPGLRMAEPGEFTRRAFLAGKIDLTAVEGLADLIDAETEAQRRQALRQAGGALARLYEDWAARLTRTLAHWEASIDFVDEELPDALSAEAWATIAALRSEIAAHLADGGRGERLRAGLRVAITGKPNAGKSSLLNRLAEREAAIVSAVPGTTRDVIELHFDIDGYPVVVADTAGIRDSDDPVEAEGVRRARQWASAADLRVLVIDGVGEAADAVPVPEADTLVFVNKADAWGEEVRRGWGDAIAGIARRGGSIHSLSLATGAGWGEARAALHDAVVTRCGVGEVPLLTRARHREALSDCGAALARCAPGRPVEVVAEELRRAVHALGRITGRVDVEALLDIVFRDFCIGK